MSRIATTEPNLYHALLVYRTSFAAFRLRGLVRSLLRLESIESGALPPQVRTLLEWVGSSSELLRQPGFQRRRRLPMRTAALCAEQNRLREALARSWGGENHLAFLSWSSIEAEVDSGGDYRPPVEYESRIRSVLPDEPFEAVEHEALLWAAELPDDLVLWNRLGTVVARLLSNPTSRQMVNELEGIHVQLFTGVLQGVPLNLSDRAFVMQFATTSAGYRLRNRESWLIECLHDYDESIQDRLAGRIVVPAASRPAMTRQQRRMLAVTLRIQNPTWTDQQIANEVGCVRTSLYRWQPYVDATEQSRAARRAQLEVEEEEEGELD